MDVVGKKSAESSYIPGYNVEQAALAYVKPIVTNTGGAFAVCAEDGTQLAIFGSRDAAVIAARQHDLEPVFIH